MVWWMALCLKLSLDPLFVCANSEGTFSTLAGFHYYQKQNSSDTWHNFMIYYFRETQAMDAPGISFYFFKHSDNMHYMIIW